MYKFIWFYTISVALVVPTSLRFLIFPDYDPYNPDFYQKNNKILTFPDFDPVNPDFSWLFAIWLFILTFGYPNPDFSWLFLTAGTLFRCPASGLNLCSGVYFRHILHNLVTKPYVFSTLNSLLYIIILVWNGS